jgi:hypothetical protein
MRGEGYGTWFVYLSIRPSVCYHPFNTSEQPNMLMSTDWFSATLRTVEASERTQIESSVPADAAGPWFVYYTHARMHVLSQSKKELLLVEFEPATLCSLNCVRCQLSSQSNPAG